MTRPSFIRTLVAVCVSAMLAVALSGCMQQASTQGNDQQSENREYMTQVNQKMDDLDSRLSDFVDAVSRGDVVTMRTQADNAFKVLDDLSSLEAPEPLKDVAAGYVDGANSLKDALNSYIQLYTEIDGATTTVSYAYTISGKVMGIVVMVMMMMPMTPTETSLSMMLPRRRISSTWLTKSQTRTKTMMPMNTLSDRDSFITR